MVFCHLTYLLTCTFYFTKALFTLTATTAMTTAMEEWVTLVSMGVFTWRPAAKATSTHRVQYNPFFPLPLPHSVWTSLKSIYCNAADTNWHFSMTNYNCKGGNLIFFNFMFIVHDSLPLKKGRDSVETYFSMCAHYILFNSQPEMNGGCFLVAQQLKALRLL